MASFASCRPLSAAALLAASLLLPSALPGQEAPAAGAGLNLGLSPEEGPQLVSLDFPGGNLSSYVDLLREKFDVNAVVAPDTSDYPMPPLSLKKVSMGTAMNLIEAMSRSLSGDAGTVTVNTLSDQEGTPVFIVDLKSPTIQTGLPGLPPPQGARGIPQRIFRGGGTQVAGPSPQPVRTLQVFSIKLLTQPIPGRNDLAMPADNVLTAIDTALGLSSGDEPAQIKYHPETGLIFVHGTPGQLEAVGTLIRTLNDDQMTLRKTAPPTDDLQKFAERLREENEALRAEIAALGAELRELKSRIPLESPRGSNPRPQPIPRPETTRP